MKKLVVSVGSTDEKRVFNSFSIVKSSSYILGHSELFLLFDEQNGSSCVFSDLQSLFNHLIKSIDF